MMLTRSATLPAGSIGSPFGLANATASGFVFVWTGLHLSKLNTVALPDVRIAKFFPFAAPPLALSIQR